MPRRLLPASRRREPGPDGSAEPGRGSRGGREHCKQPQLRLRHACFARRRARDRADLRDLFEHREDAATVTLYDGRSLAARLLEVDKTWDLAALEVAPVEITAIAVAADFPRQNDVVVSSGFGPDGRYVASQGRVLGYVETGGTRTHETLQWTGSARQGDSGGPAVNSRGQLVAVLWGTDGRTVAGTYCGRIRQFLARLLPSARRPPEQPAVPVVPRRPAEPPLPPAPVEEAIADNAAQKDVAQRIDEVAKRLDSTSRQSAAERQLLASRLEKVERDAAEVDRLRRRVDDLAAVVARVEKPQSVSRENSGPEGSTPGPPHAAETAGAAAIAIEKLWPYVASALGISVGSPAAGLAIWGLLSLLRRRAKKRIQGSGFRAQEEGGTPSAPSALPSSSSSQSPIANPQSPAPNPQSPVLLPGQQRTENVYIRVPTADPVEEAKRRAERNIAMADARAAAFFSYRDRLAESQLKPSERG